MISFGKKVTPIIGIDIGSEAIKVSQFLEEKGKLRLVNFAVMPTPANAVSGGKIVKTQPIADALLSILSNYSFIGKRVSASVSGQLVTVKQVSIDEIPRQSLEDIIKWEMEKHISYPIDEAVFDFEILSRSVGEDGETKVNCLVAVVPLETVNALVSSIKLASLEPVYIEVEPFAELRLTQYVSAKRENLAGKTLVLINIGSNLTSINVVDGSLIRVTRMIPFGGLRITNAIIASMGGSANISLERADEMKQDRVDIDPSVHPEAESDLETATTATLQVVDELVLEIRRSLNYYSTRFENLSPLHIILSGGSANLKGIAAYIEIMTGYETEINEMLVDVAAYNENTFEESYLRSMSPMFTVATGLSLREIVEKSGKKKQDFQSKKRNDVKHAELVEQEQQEGV